MNIAILGARGIPACYSGYDTLVEELAQGLVKSGEAQVLVYCRTSYYEVRPANIDGIRLVYLPAPRIKAFESLLHSFLSSLHVLSQKVDIVYFVDPANAPFCLLLRLFGKKVLIHTDGLGWKRRKWGPVARRYYKFVEWLSAKFITELITDNPEMKRYYLEEYRADSTYIPFGATNNAVVDKSILKRLDLKQENYMLVVARLERENNTDLIIQEYVESGVEMPLVVVGDAPYDSDYWELLHQVADNRVRFLGRINDQSELNALYAGAYLYIHGHEVGGTNPSLLRSMNYGTMPVVVDVPFNETVVGNGGVVFKKDQGYLAEILKKLVGDPDYVGRVGQLSKIKAETEFTWESVVADHKKLFEQVLQQ